jgi:hypothetical protein
MSELKVNTISSYSGSGISVNANNINIIGDITARKAYIGNYSLDASDPNANSLVASKFYVDQQFLLRGIGATGISGLSQLQAGLSAEAQAIRAESDAKYLFDSRHNTHTSAGMTFSGGPYRFGSAGTVLAVDIANSRVGVGLLNPQTALQVSGQFSLGNSTERSTITNNASNNLIINSWNSTIIQNASVEKLAITPTLATLRLPLTCTGAVAITDTTASTSKTTGALTVAGGASISGNLWIGGFMGATTSASTRTNIDGINLRGAIHFTDSGGDSGISGVGMPYGIYQEGGLWGSPYPDYRFDAHTGLKIVAYTTYGGTRFYSDWRSTAPSDILFSVGNGDNNIRVRDNLYISGTTVSTSTGTGALTVAGGVGITGALNVGGSVGVSGGLNVVGSLGIGTQTPAVALDVNGEARSSTSTTSASNANTLTTKDYVDSTVMNNKSIFTSTIVSSSQTIYPNSLQVGESRLYIVNSGTLTIQTGASYPGVWVGRGRIGTSPYYQTDFWSTTDTTGLLNLVPDTGAATQQNTSTARTIASAGNFAYVTRLA